MSYLGNTPTQQAFTPAVDFFSGNGSTVAFTLSRPVASVAQVQATIENVPQNPGTAFTVSGNTITFDGAPPSGTNNIYVYYTSPITQVIQPGQGTVGTAQIQNGAVIPADLSTGAPFWDTSGNLGVGTTSPATRLHIAGATTATSQLTAQHTGSAITNLFGCDGSIDVGAVYVTTNHPLAFRTNNTERMRITSGGNIGMGTIAPGAETRLTVRGLGTTSSTASFEAANSSGNTRFYVRDDGTTSFYGSSFAETVRIAGDGNLQFNSGYGSVATAYGCRAWVDFNGNGTPAIRASGNVSSITDNAAGNFTINLTTAMPDTNYTAISDSNNGVTANPNSAMRSSSARPLTSSTIGFFAFPNDASGTLIDSDYNNLAVFR